VTDLIDLRSDTLTKPIDAMRAAMARAEVGDDVYGEDPTINALEAQVAELFGHEAALFVPSGTMGNQLGVRTLVAPGDELLCDADAHVVTYEHGAAAAHGGITTRTWTSERGIIDVDAAVAMVRPRGWGTVATAAIAVENTHNRGGGTVQPIDSLRSLHEQARDVGIALHCDGARIGVPLGEYGRLFDTLSVCLSKGLGAPVGSLLVSTTDRIAMAREMRKRLGGGMRQAGVLAAAGQYALEHHLDRLAEDHQHARTLAAAVGVNPSIVETNIVPIDVPDPVSLSEKTRAEGVLISVVGPRKIRLVTHLDVGDEDIMRACEVLGRLID
jgi:threonine aldolase